MFLSDFIGKPVCVGVQPKAVCLGVGLSLKTRAIKYLLCATSPLRKTPDFAVNFSAVTKIDETITLTRLRAVFPKSCARITPQLPVYSYEGGLLGNLTDMEIQNFTVTRLFTNRNESFSALSIIACGDAVILRKEQPYPLGQRIPAPMLSFLGEKTEPIVTKPVLRSAIAKGALIELTLSLPPFSVRK